MSQKSLSATSTVAAFFAPTNYPPRSPGKLRILALRARLGLPLFHPQDAPLAEGEVLLAETRRNGEIRCTGLGRQGVAGVQLLEASAPALPPRRRPLSDAQRSMPSYRAREAARKREARRKRRVAV